MIIGLTGGIGSGKTIVSKLFETLGCVIYNSDNRAKNLYFNSEVKQHVISLLGQEAYTNDGELNKVFISQTIFSNEDKLKQLNSIIHPVVKKDFDLFVKSYPAEILIIKESALLFEENLHLKCDATILVTAPIELKIARTIKRNTLTQIEIEKRMLTQWADEQKIPLADFVIVNDEKQALVPQVLAIFDKFKNNA
jgi:dephospho-CoA kinase